jgi:hypothetical protein
LLVELRRELGPALRDLASHREAAINPSRNSMHLVNADALMVRLEIISFEGK